MRIAFITRLNLYKIAGGDTVQIEQTARQLTNLGIEVDILRSVDVIPYEKYDVLHFFGIPRPGDMLFHSKLAKMPFVVSTIHCTYGDYYKYNRQGVGAFFANLSADSMEYFKTIARWLVGKDHRPSLNYFLTGQRKSIIKVLETADFILPNSQSESNRLKQLYTPNVKSIIVTNGINPEKFPYDATIPKDENLVICVGRIENRKNQLNHTSYNQRTLFTGEYEMVGFDQYVAILSDADFWMALLRSVVFTAALVIGSVLVGTGMSHLMTRLGTVMRYIVTVVLILSWAMPNVASSLIWKWLFQPQYGVINWVLTQTHFFGDMTSVNWAADPVLAWVCIWLLVVWQAVPFIALTLYAAEMQVSIELKEAARLDGASEFKVYRVVVLPSLRPTLLLVTMLSIIWDFNVFNQIWLISAGGPDGATSTLGVFTYTTAFSGNAQIGEGSAIAVASTLILIVLSALYIRNLVRSGEEF